MLLPTPAQQNKPNELTGLHVVQFVVVEIDYACALNGGTLDREVHVSNLVEQIETRYDGLKEEYFKKLWKPAEEA